MQYFQPERDHRASLLALLATLDASPRALHRVPLDGRNKSDGGEPLPYAIFGKSGHIYADGTGYLLCVNTDESPRRWTNVKKRLGFCQVRQDGDDEGCLHLHRLPVPREAIAIRDALGIRKRRKSFARGYGPGSLRAGANQSRAKSTSGGLVFLKRATAADGHPCDLDPIKIRLLKPN